MILHILGLLLIFALMIVLLWGLVTDLRGMLGKNTDAWYWQVGEKIWTAWKYLFGFVLYPIGIVSWWVDPLFGGPVWGRIIAAFITLAGVILIKAAIKRREGIK